MNVRPMAYTSLAVIGGMVLASVWAWLQLPADAQVPIHWGPSGQPDGWADKTTGLFLMPAVALAITGLFIVIPRIEPRRTNLERSVTAYRAVWIGVIVLFGGLHLLAVGVALGAELDLTRIVLTGTGVLFVVIGNYLPKVRPNYLMGIRTPWTLASDLSWVKTHRIGGRLFVIEGIAIAALGLLGISGIVLVAILLGGIVALLAVSFVVSYRVWKSDPAKRGA